MHRQALYREEKKIEKCQYPHIGKSYQQDKKGATVKTVAPFAYRGLVALAIDGLFGLQIGRASCRERV